MDRHDRAGPAPGQHAVSPATTSRTSSSAHTQMPTRSTSAASAAGVAAIVTPGAANPSSASGRRAHSTVGQAGLDDAGDHPATHVAQADEPDLAEVGASRGAQSEKV